MGVKLVMAALDGIIKGNVITLGDAHPRVEAVGFKGGMITALGSMAEVEAGKGPDTEVLDLKGDTVLPGFYDTHVHPCYVGTVALNVDLTTATSIDEILARLKAKADTTASGDPVLAFNFNGDIVRERRLPTRAELDRVSPDHPLAVIVYDVHSAMLSTKMLAQLDMASQGEGVDRDARGDLTGLVEDPAIAHVLRKLQPDDDDVIMASAEAACREALQLGITTLHMKEPIRNLEVILRHRDRFPIGIKPLVMVKPQDIEALPQFITKVANWERATVAFYADGAPDSKTAAFFEPYVGEETNFGMLYYKDHELEDLVGAVHRAGLQASIHTCGTRATEQVIKVYEKVLAKSPRAGHRHRIEHFEMPHGAQIRRAVAAGLTFAMQPMFLFLSGAGTFENIRSLLGDQPVERWKPFRTILDAGGLVAGGSDAPVTKMSPLNGIAACVNHPNECQRITRYEALKMFTADAAFIGFEEARKGSIEIGKRADFTVLGQNPFTVRRDEIGAITVKKTVVGGEVVFEAE
jgi:predicted amidohydrolase YtcJ